MKMKSQEFSFEFKGKEGLFAGSRKCVDREVYCGLRGAGGSAPAKNDLMCRQKYQSIYIRATIQLPAISIASISLCSLIKLGAGCSFGVLAAALIYARIIAPLRHDATAAGCPKHQRA
jgi:hypothetical protein